MDLESRKRNHSEVSQASIPSPVNIPKKQQTMTDMDDPSYYVGLENILENQNMTFENQDDFKMSSDSKIENMDSLTKTAEAQQSNLTLDDKIASLDGKIDEVLHFLKSEKVQRKLDYDTLQRENNTLKLQLKECEGTVAKLNATVSTLENKIDSLQIYSMRSNLVFHNIPEEEGEDCYAQAVTFMHHHLKIQENLLFSAANPLGEIRVDVAHRVGLKGERPRSLIVKFLSHRGRDLALSHAKNLKKTPFAISEHFPANVRERRTAQIPLLMEKRDEAKKTHTKTSVKLVGDKLLINSKVNTETFEMNPFDTTLPAAEPIDVKNLIHSSPVTVKGSIFQGHLYPVVTEGEVIQAIRAISQDKDLAKSEHTMYAYNFIDPDGETRSGFCDDGEWSSGSLLAGILREKELSNVVIIVTRKFGGVHLGKRRFELIRQVANETLAQYSK